VKLEWRVASDDDAKLLAGFWCWSGGEDYWAEEVENHIRGWVLSRSDVTLLFTEQAELVAVSAFSRRNVDMRTAVVPGWLLDVVAVDLHRQGEGLASEVFAGTFEAMKMADPDRVVVSAKVHDQNLVSRSAATRAGITALRPLADGYWEFLGTTPL